MAVGKTGRGLGIKHLLISEAMEFVSRAALRFSEGATISRKKPEKSGSCCNSPGERC